MEGHVSHCHVGHRCVFCSEDPSDGLGKLRVDDLRKLLALYKDQVEMLGKDNAYFKVTGGVQHCMCEHVRCGEGHSLSYA